MITKEESISLWEKGDLNTLVEGHMWMAENLGRKYAGPIAEEDLVQEGYVGLVEAAQKYDPRKGASFYTFASLSIKHRILKAISTQKQQFRVSDYTGQKMQTVKKTEEAMMQKLQRAITPQELAAATGVTESFVRWTDLMSQPVSLDDLENTDNLLPTGSDFTDTVHEEMMAEPILEALAQLSEEEQDIVFSYAGYFDGHKKSYNAIARERGVSDSTIRNRLFSARKKVKSYLDKRIAPR